MSAVRFAPWLLALVASGVAAQAPEPPLARGPGHGEASRVVEGEVRLPSLLEAAGPGLVEKDGTVSWKALAAITTIRRENADGKYGRFVAYFAEPVLRSDVAALAGRTVRVRGYMLPRLADPGRTRFLVAATPAADADGCASAGPETIVDVTIPAVLEAKVDRLVTVEGTLELFDAQRWSGYIYRLAGAKIVDTQ